MEHRGGISGLPVGGGDAVRALTRGLAILRYVNGAGGARPSEIAAALDIPRPTVYRLLRTLEELGYVALSPTDNRVRVTRLAASLGDGYAASSRLCQLAGPLFSEFGPQIVWPLALSVYDNAEMVIEEATHHRSPMSIDRDMIGLRVPALRSASGRAYLAFCRDEERKIILDHIRRMDCTEDRPFLEEVALRRMLDTVSARGFAVRECGEFRSQTASIAAPVVIGSSVAACVSVVWIRSAMDTAQAVQRYEAPLLEIAGRLAEAGAA